MKFVKKYWQEILLVVFILIAAILRFWDITKLQFFTYDQARDALFIKRMIVDHKWRLLGTQTSLPGMYLPPFYFYTILPVLWLSKLNPVGIDIYSAFIGVLTVPVVFYVANKIFGKPAGVFSAGIFAVSPIVVELTRRAWNCNTLPFYILITFFFIYQYYKERKLKDFLLGFAFYGYSLSLHFGAWTLLPLFVITWFFFLIKAKQNKLIGLVSSLAILFFFVSPILFFEIRHNFFLVSQAKVFFFDGGHIGVSSGANFFESLISSLVSLFTILTSGKITVGYGAPLEFSGRLKEFFVSSQQISVVAQKPFSLTYQWWGTGIFILIPLYSIFKIINSRKNGQNENLLPLILVWVWILWAVFASRIYSGKFFFFYYLFVFPAPILLFGYFFKKLFSSKLLRIPAFIVFIAILLFHIRFTTIFQHGWRNIDDLKRVSTIIAQNAPSKEPFNIATIQRDLDRWDRNSVDYRYFVETFGKKTALDWFPEDYESSKYLFVVDETSRTDVVNSNIMEIQKFSPKSIVGKYDGGNGITIYKLDKK